MICDLQVLGVYFNACGFFTENDFKTDGIILFFSSYLHVGIDC